MKIEKPPYGAAALFCCCTGAFAPVLAAKMIHDMLTDVPKMRSDNALWCVIKVECCLFFMRHETLLYNA